MYNFPAASCIYKEDIYSKIEIHLYFKISCFRDDKQVLSKKIIKTKLLTYKRVYVLIGPVANQ